MSLLINNNLIKLVDEAENEIMRAVKLSGDWLLLSDNKKYHLHVYQLDAAKDIMLDALKDNKPSTPNTEKEVGHFFQLITRKNNHFTLHQHGHELLDIVEYIDGWLVFNHLTGSEYVFKSKGTAFSYMFDLMNFGGYNWE